jgi:hypothetical protein
MEHIRIMDTESNVEKHHFIALSHEGAELDEDGNLVERNSNLTDSAENPGNQTSTPEEGNKDMVTGSVPPANLTTNSTSSAFETPLNTTAVH